MAEPLDATLQVAVDAVLAHEWRPSSPRTAHQDHQYDAECAVCQGDVAAVLAVAAPLIAEQARAEERAAIVGDLRTFAESGDPLSAQDHEFIGHRAYHVSGASVAAVMRAVADKIEKGKPSV